MWPPKGTPSGSRAKVVERWMGGATEPVDGSTACPARTARVSNRMPKAYREFGGRPLSRFLRRGARCRWWLRNVSAGGATLDRALLRAGDRALALQAVGDERHAGHELAVR